MTEDRDDATRWKLLYAATLAYTAVVIGLLDRLTRCFSP